MSYPSRGTVKGVENLEDDDAGGDFKAPSPRAKFMARPEAFLRMLGREGLLPIIDKFNRPRRPIDLGWRTVCAQVHRRLGPTDIRRDPWIEVGHRYLQALLDCQSDQDIEALARQMPEIHAAYTIYRTSDKFLRGRLEAYLLTPRPFDDVAKVCEISPATVECYERLFFKVRSRLCRPFIVRQIAFDGLFCHGMQEGDVDLMLKKAASLAQGAQLESMIRYYTFGCRLPERWDEVTRDRAIELHDRLWNRVLILAWALPAAPPRREEILAELLGELKQVIDSWPEGALTPDKGPFGSLPIPDKINRWWLSWRKAASLAAGKLPARRSGKLGEAD